MEVVEFALGVAVVDDGRGCWRNMARGIDCEAIRQPLGVCVGITPFNFSGDGGRFWMYPIGPSPGKIERA